MAMERFFRYQFVLDGDTLDVLTMFKLHTSLICYFLLQVACWLRS